MKRPGEFVDVQPLDQPVLRLHADLKPLIEDDEAAKELLRPYDNLAALYSRMSSGSRLFRQAPHIREQVIAAFQEDTDEDVLTVLDSLSEARREFMPKHNPVATALSLITTGRELQRVRDGVPPEQTEARQHAFKVYNALSTLDMRNTANEIPGEELIKTYQVTHYLSRMVAELGQHAPDPEIKADAGVLGYFGTIVMNRIVSREYLKHLSGGDVETPSLEEAAADSRAIAELFQEIQTSRRFGMKRGYILDDRGGSFVFGSLDNLAFVLDRPESHRLLDDMYHVSEAIIVHSEKRNFKDIRIKTRDTGEKDSLKTSMIDLTELRAINDIHLGPDGELYNDATCKDPLLSTALEVGKYTAYRDLQATILSHYYDLTHPVEVVASIKEAEKAAPLASVRTTNEPTELITKLLIPRIHYRQEGNQRDDDKNSEEEETEQARRTVRRHDVTWHIRKLPEGWNPSPEALQLASDMRVSLLPGETIVRDHKRGSKLLGEVVGHKLISRS